MTRVPESTSPGVRVPESTSPGVQIVDGGGRGHARLTQQRDEPQLNDGSVARVRRLLDVNPVQAEDLEA